uniref:Fibronectin type-III domain-containing protein n=1 Tax=Biomphalaria glabrata TaxID=6526 RepID=A0A2C9KYW6_BIOGL
MDLKDLFESVEFNIKIIYLPFTFYNIKSNTYNYEFLAIIISVTEIAVSNISASVETNNITLNWNVTKQYSSNVTYTIKTDFGKSESVTSNGGIISGLQSGSKYNFTVVSTPPKDTFVNYSDYSVPSEPFWTYAVYGNVCDSEQSYPECVYGYDCRTPNNTAPKLCLCNTSQFWSSGCVDIKEIAVSNITASVETNNITLNWNVTKQYSSNVTYTIKTDFGKSGSVTSNGGIISGLQSGSKYNFTVISTPPKDTFVNYTDYSVPSEPFWTYAVYGNICDSEQSYPECVSDYVCRTPNNTVPKLCLCNTSQFWSSGCVDIKEIAVSNITASVEINKIILNWNVTKQYSSNVTYTIKTDFGKSESVTSNGGIISGLQSGSKYNFTVISTPPKDTLVNYSDYSVPSEPFWTCKFV